MLRACQVRLFSVPGFFDDLDNTLRTGACAAPGERFHAGGNIDFLDLDIAIVIQRKQPGPAPPKACRALHSTTPGSATGSPLPGRGRMIQNEKETFTS